MWSPHALVNFPNCNETSKSQTAADDFAVTWNCYYCNYASCWEVLKTIVMQCNWAQIVWRKLRKTSKNFRNQFKNSWICWKLNFITLTDLSDIGKFNATNIDFRNPNNFLMQFLLQCFNLWYCDEISLNFQGCFFQLLLQFSIESWLNIFNTVCKVFRSSISFQTSSWK